MTLAEKILVTTVAVTAFLALMFLVAGILMLKLTFILVALVFA